MSEGPVVSQTDELGSWRHSYATRADPANFLIRGRDKSTLVLPRVVDLGVKCKVIRLVIEHSGENTAKLPLMRRRHPFSVI